MEKTKRDCLPQPNRANVEKIKQMTRCYQEREAIEKRLIERRAKEMTPERRAADKELMDRTVAAMCRGLAENNLEIFGTPIPDKLK